MCIRDSTHTHTQQNIGYVGKYRHDRQRDWQAYYKTDYFDSKWDQKVEIVAVYSKSFMNTILSLIIQFGKK